MIALALLLAAQEVPVFDEAQHMLDRMSDDITQHVAKCGVKVTFFIPPGKAVKDSQAVIDRAATPDQVACAKGMVSWLKTHDEAVAAGVFGRPARR